ncbi:uncharacterized protein METZ01_LOCUS269478, partial [marine metagenome]
MGIGLATAGFFVKSLIVPESDTIGP